MKRNMNRKLKEQKAEFVKQITEITFSVNQSLVFGSSERETE